MDKNRVVVVGAGVGGMAAALLLAAKGLDVTLLEAAATPGGKLRQVQSAGVWQDAGPTVFTMRWVFDALCADAGAQLHEHLDLHPVETLARHAWDAQTRLDLFADMGRSQDAIAQFSSPAQARQYGEFCRRAQRTYQSLEHTFMRASRPNPISLASRAGLRGLPDLARIAPFTSLWRALGEHFSDPRLRQLFGRYATYCGASPFLAPATLMLVAHVEQSGVWLVKGGMYRIAMALENLLKRHGAHVRYNSAVSRLLVRGGQVTGVCLADGEVIEARAVVFNGDVAALSSGLLGPESMRAVPRTLPSRRSLSAVTWHMLSPAKGFPLLHHTVFFSGNYADEFSDVRGPARLPQDPTVYVCAQDRGDVDAQHPAGAERIMCLVNAAATADTNPLPASAV
ncbi:MAG: FAD-dependent oxidoreductase, partial [Burkholderiaceae bacterium]